MILFYKAFEVWLLYEPEYFMNNMIIWFQLFLYILKWVAKWRRWLWEQKIDFKRHVITYYWTLRIRDELNMKQEGFPMLTVGAKGASQVK